MSKPKFKPLVTENPQGNYQWLHNMTVIKDKEVYLREYDDGHDLNIVDYCKRECKTKCDIEQEGTAEDFAENMGCDCPVALVYHMAVGHAELRERLKYYEMITPGLIESLEELLKHFSFSLPLKSDVSYSFLHPEQVTEALKKASGILTKARGESHA